MKVFRPGFTLVEIVLSSLLAVIIAGVLFAGYFYSAQAIRTGRTQVVRSESVAVFLTRMSEELAALGGEEYALSGTRDRMEFLTSEGTGLGLARVSYRVSEAGENRVVVFRSEALPWEKIAGENGGGDPVFQAGRMAFAYYDGNEWLEEWFFADNPLLVSLELSTAWGDYEVWARPRTGTGLDPGPDPDALPDGG